MRSRSSAVTKFVVLAAIGVALAGCGRRGALEYPVNPEDPAVQASGLKVQSSGTGKGEQKVIRGYVVPEKKFILDPLL